MNIRQIYIFFCTLCLCYLFLLFLTPVAIAHWPPWITEHWSISLLFKLVSLYGDLACHQRPERSFFIHGVQMALCVRCLGITIGFCIATLVSVKIVPFGEFYTAMKKMFFLDERTELYTLFAIIFLFVAPMAFDGGIQLITNYDSPVHMRMITGILYGYAEGSACIAFISQHRSPRRAVQYFVGT